MSNDEHLICPRHGVYWGNSHDRCPVCRQERMNENMEGLMSKYQCNKCKGSRFKTVDKANGVYRCRKCGTLSTPQQPAKMVED